MAGKNLFESLYRSLKTLSPTGFCVFISHNTKDKAFARAVATALQEMDVDIYFDEKDLVLQAAAKEGDDRAIVACIEDGLNKCTHLLGIITSNTRDSWWVPYEIGGATGRSKNCAHIIGSSVVRLPSYLKVAPVLLSDGDLTNWLSKTIQKPKYLLEKSFTSRTRTILEGYIPQNRDPTAIVYY